MEFTSPKNSSHDSKLDRVLGRSFIKNNFVSSPSENLSTEHVIVPPPV